MTLIDLPTGQNDPVAQPSHRGVRGWFGLRPGRRPTPRRRGRAVAAATPWWARLFVRGGSPLVAIIVMVLCAPGEHHLAQLAGWSDHLAWGMPAVLAAYAGMAAFMAGERRREDAPGKLTATVGAVVSLTLAMAAQPLSHLFATGWLSSQPRAPWGLVVVVSCVPPLVLGHILHLAGTGNVRAHSEVSQGIPEVSPEEEGLLTTAEVAQELGITPSAVASRIHRGTLTVARKDPRLGNLFRADSLPISA